MNTPYTCCELNDILLKYIRYSLEQWDLQKLDCIHTESFNLNTESLMCSRQIFVCIFGLVREINVEGAVVAIIGLLSSLSA